MLNWYFSLDNFADVDQETLKKLNEIDLSIESETSFNEDSFVASLDQYVSNGDFVSKLKDVKWLYPFPVQSK